MEARFEGGWLDGQIEEIGDHQGQKIVVERKPGAALVTWTPGAPGEPGGDYRPDRFDVYERGFIVGAVVHYRLIDTSEHADG